MRTLYFRANIAPRPVHECSVLHVDPLLRELVVETVRLGQLRYSSREHRALCAILQWRLRGASAIPTSITMPVDRRALRLAQAVIGGDANGQTLVATCRRAGISVRTLERIFRREVGMNFEAWRRQVRLMKAVELLVEGRTVKEVAYEVGYQQSSSFVEMFRQTFGTTPKAWVSANQSAA